MRVHTVGEGISAGGVAEARPAFQQARGGATPTPALQGLHISPVQTSMARALIIQNHYLHTFPAGTHLTFGIFDDGNLRGAISLGVGPYNTPSLVEGASFQDCLTLTRFWLSDQLPKYSESRVLGNLLRCFKRNTSLKFLVTYADPAQGDVGTIYQASNWLYTGLSHSVDLYDFGDGKLRHCRSVAATFGSRSVRYFARHGVAVKLVPQADKHRYVYFLDPTWTNQLKVSNLPYPKRKSSG